MDCRQIEAATAAFSAITNYITQSVAYTNVKEKLAKQTEELLKAENKRIQLMFGEKLTFHIESKEQSGTTITINLLK